MSSQSERDQEEKVARSLRSKGARVERSKGGADLIVKFPTGTKWYVQVKSTRSRSASNPDMGRLRQNATRNKATIVVARITPNGIEYESARTRRKLNPSKSRVSNS